MASDRIWGDRKGKTVILDTSAIMMLFEFHISLEDELTRLLGKYHIVIPRRILEELEFLSKNGTGKQKIIAKPALKLVKQKKYEVLDEDISGEGDEVVFSLAKKLNGIVVTNDRELINNLKKASLHVVYLRGKNRLALEWTD